ncbi:hypothetical protein ACEZCY_14755 [Streptacidiphilus sp. N1-12]|uniref:Concanavalin A-like lectin/glucanases superfamily protein n=2 Tax=Streptacidiphilus alkalitolerans TaxID=3342712 RepID=A0ABV6V9X2_9ACTN
MAVPGLLANWPRIAFQIAWNTGGPQPATPYWTDLTARLQGSWTATQSGRQYELDDVASGSMSVTLDNTDGMFDSTNPSGPYYGSIRPYRLARMTATWPPSQNLLPKGLANGSDLLDALPISGTLALATVAAAPSGHTSAVAWTFPAAGTALTVGFGLGAHNASFGTACDSDAIPVVSLKGPAVGRQFTITSYLSALAGGTSGLSLLLRISWYRQDGTRITTTDGAAVTVPVQPSWVRATVTGTAPAGAVWLRYAVLNAATTAVSNTVYATGAQVELAGAATAWADPGTTYALWTGYLERTKQRWKGAQGFADVPCVDSLAGLSRMVLQQSLQASLLALGPDRLYPLDEPTGSTTFRDQTSAHPALTIGNSTLGAGSVTAGNAVTGSGSVGAPGPVVTITNPAPTGFNQAGSFLQLPTPNGPPSSGGWGRIICFRTSTTPPAGQVSALWWWGAPTGNASQAGMYIDSGGHVNASAANAAGQSVTTNVTTVPVCDGNWHMAVIILRADGMLLSLNVDGTGANGPSSFDLHGTGIRVDTIGMNANPINKSFTWGFTGDVAYACELPTNLLPTFPDLATGFATGWAGESSGARAQRILAMAGYTGAFSALGTATAMGAINVAGNDAVASLKVCADSEAGQAYVDGAGTVTLAGRRWRYLHFTPDIVFGENTGAGEIPYLGGVEVDLDPDHIYNTWAVTNQSAPNGVQQPDALGANALSQSEYFASSQTRTINVLDPAEALAAASYLASQYAEPQPRISKVVIDPSANAALWPACLGLGFGSRARLMRRPNGSPNTIQVETFVEQISWKGDDTGRLQLTSQLSAATPYLGWWIIASLHSTLQAVATAGTNTITLGPLTGAALNAAAAVLPVGTVLTVGYGTAAAENVTVKSVGATTAGYTSVVVTLTANLTSTHASGLTVCQPLPGGYSMPASTLAGFPASLDAGATLSDTSPRVSY